MSSGSSPVSGGGNVLKTIIIGVATTVLGAAAVYFLGFHEKKENPKKEATETAMKSLVQYEQVLEKTLISLACNSASEYSRQLFLREVEQLKNNMKNVKSDKDVDNRVFSLVDRRVMSLDELTKASESYFNNLSELNNNNQLTQVEAVAKSLELQKKYNNRLEQISQEEKTFKDDIIAALKKDYKLDLDIEPLQIKISEANITGKWLINQFVLWTIKADHTFTWDAGDQHFNGTWSLEDDVVHIKFSHPETAEFKILRLYSDILSYKNLEDGTAWDACRQ